MDRQSELADAAYEAIVRLKRARTALRTTIKEYNLDSTNIVENEGMYIVWNITEIYNMLEIVDDYMLDANRQLERAMA